ncbi:alpha-galactosidase [Melissococcus plutonius DAT561]|nr:alpha-galactosidase [Melissococcus plutonius DAT561]
MISGLWLEIEVMGIHCPLADKLPDDWFFTRHGKRVIDIDRYHLDFRNKEVIAYADQVLDRLITDYGIGYIKMDYNITTGIGTDYLSDSYGEGLLAHNRAYLNWLDHLFQRYPDLVIENCGSGGMRHDYAMLSRHSLQSLTDQTDYLRNGAIAAVGASAVTPEQCAVWSYPLEDGDEEEVIYNMINSLLLRVHQSGYLNKLSDNRFKLVTEGLNVYKQIRQQILKSLPIWPTGLAKLDDSKYTFGLIGDRQLLLAVWNNKQKENLIEVDLTKYGKVETVTQIYPKAPEYQTTIFNVNNQVAFKFETAPSARLYKITLEK